MNSIAAWTHLPLAGALAWALVHFVWEGALIALLAGAILTLCRRANARYTVACAGMLALLAAFALTFALSVPGPRTPAPPPRFAMAALEPGMAAGAPVSPTILARIERVLPWTVPFWMTGVFLLGLYRLAGWMAAQRMRRAGVCAAPPEWQQRLGRLARRIGVSKPLVLLESSLAETPLLIGLLRPAILIPAGLLTGLPASQLEAILLHELAHIRRFDYLVNLIQTVVESLLFYHPAVWWLSQTIRVERENCCDDMVVALEGDAHAYAAALVTLEERRYAGREPALAATGGELMNRIRRLLNQREQPRPAAAPILSLGLLLGVFCLFAVAQQTTPNDQPAQTRKALADPYRKWLNEDVAYLIKDEERTAFKRLATDEEREHFIEQFWLRRDPTPGTVANEFKEEHYRRIAYANLHYASRIPGWKTDRGRIYIVYGPPDAIEDHSLNGYQIWTYRHIEGIGDNVVVEFKDTDGTGELRMTSDPAAR